MGTVSSKAPPYPWSALINDKGVRTRGDIVGRNVQALGKSVPTSQEYGDEDLYRERTFAFECPLGFGESIQRSHTSQRCRYGLNAWFSGKQRGKGPKWNSLVPTTSGPVNDFIQALHGGVLTQFILAGQYVLRRDSDASAGQAISHDFGAGRTVLSAARFKPAGGGTDSLYVTLDNGELWNYNGSSWTGPAAAGGSWSGKAYLCVVVDNDFYIKDTQNTVRRCTADPMAGASYSGQFGTADFGSAGDGSLTITGLAAHSRVVWIFTDNGKVFTLNSDGSSNDLYPGLQTTPVGTNGAKPASDTMGNLYFRNGSSWFRIDGSGVASPIGPERLLQRDAEVNGVAQVFAWYESYYGFFGLYNTSNGASYLIQFGDWIPGGDTDGFVFVETFNGALVKWAGKQITAMRDMSIGGVPRLYCGFADGSYGYIRLPQNTPNPFAQGSGCEFADGGTGPSECYWPRHTMMKPRDNKAFLDLAEFGPVLNADNYVSMECQTDFAGAYDSCGILNTNARQLQFQNDTVGTAIDLKEVFISNDSRTPVVESLVLREQLRPALRMEWVLNIIDRHYVPLRNGGSTRIDPLLLRAHIADAAASPRSTTLVLPDEAVGAFSLVTYQETFPQEANRYGQELEIQASFVSYRTLDVYGTIDRLDSMTIDALGTFTIDELGVL